MDLKPVELKLMVDLTSNRVAFVESGKEFVDILLSFLTLPLGAVFRLLDKPSSFGSIASLYSCVESFDSQYLVNETSRTMLLCPRNAAIRHCKRLRLDDPDSGRYYTCPLSPLRQCRYVLLSSFRNVQCHCSREMNAELHWFGTSPVDEGEGFAEAASYVITDDLFVTPISDTTSTLEKLGVKDWKNLREKIVKINHSEVLNLLKCSLSSKTPLTDVLLHKGNQRITTPMRMEGTAGIPQSSDETATGEPKTITIKLVINNKRLLHAEAKHDFVDFIFSFLTFPMGSIERLLGARSTLGCMDTLYLSALHLSSVNCLDKERENLILNPKLPPSFGVKSQLLRIKEERRAKYYAHQEQAKKKYSPCRCVCTTFGAFCPCGNTMNLCMDLIDPRNPKESYESKGGGYLRSSTAYMVTDELLVTPLSIVTGLAIRKAAKGKVEEMEIKIGEAEALALLRATMTSKTPLTDALLARLDEDQLPPVAKKLKCSP